MRDWKLSCICAAVLLTATTAMGAYAQAGGQRGGRGGGRNAGPLTIATVPVDLLATELKLTDDQKTKITAARTKMQQDLQAARPAAGAATDRQAQAAKRQEINQQAVKDIEEVLTPDQKKQEPDLIKNLSALRSTGIPMPTYGDLKLTDEQRTKLAALAGDIDKDRAQKMKDMQEARQAGDQAKVTEIQQSLRGGNTPNEKALALLTDSQKETITKYQKDHPARAGRGGRQGAAPPPVQF